MMTISFLVNVLVLAMVIPSLWVGSPGMEAAFGADTVARRILICIYAAIWAMSLVGLALMGFGAREMAVSLGVGLLSVQVIYKLLTVAAVGLGNPVVVTNLAIAILHIMTLAVVLLIHYGALEKLTG